MASEVGGYVTLCQSSQDASLLDSDEPAPIGTALQVTASIIFFSESFTTKATDADQLIPHHHYYLKAEEEGKCVHERL